MAGHVRPLKGKKAGAKVNTNRKKFKVGEKNDSRVSKSRGRESTSANSRKRRRKSTLNSTSGSRDSRSSTDAADRRSRSRDRSPPRKRCRRATSIFSRLPYRSPTPPRTSSPSDPPYGGLTVRNIRNDDKPPSTTSDVSSDVDEDIDHTDDESQDVEKGIGEKPGEELSRCQCPSWSSASSKCPKCKRRQLKSILKIRIGPYPPPREKGRRAKRKIRFSKIARRISETNTISLKRKRSQRSDSSTKSNKRRRRSDS